MKSTQKSREEIDAEIFRDLRALKKSLKQLSKNQLINVVFDQMNRNMEQRQANEILLEQLEELKNGENNEDT